MLSLTSPSTSYQQPMVVDDYGIGPAASLQQNLEASHINVKSQKLWDIFLFSFPLSPHAASQGTTTIFCHSWDEYYHLKKKSSRPLLVSGTKSTKLILYVPFLVQSLKELKITIPASTIVTLYHIWEALRKGMLICWSYILNKIK